MNLTVPRGSCAEDTDLGTIAFREDRTLLKKNMYSEENRDGALGGGSKVNLARMVTVCIAGDVLRHW